MISRDLRVDQIDPGHYANLWQLMHPPAGGDPEPQIWGPLAQIFSAPAPDPDSLAALSPRLPALALFSGARVVRVIQVGGGVLPSEELRSFDQAGLRAYRASQGLPFVAAVDLEALPQLWAEAQRKVKLGDDLVAQELSMLRVFQGALGRQILVEPQLMGSLPLPTYAMLQKAFDHMLPDGRSLVFYLVDQGRIWTSLIAVKEGGDIVRVTGHGAIAREVRFSSIRSDAKAVNQAVAQRLAPPHIGIYLPLRIWHELVAGDRSAVARAIANRQALLDPAPPWLLAIVGAGAVAEAANRSLHLASKLLSRTKLGSRFLPDGGKAKKLVQRVSNPLEMIGLDPWEMLRWSRDWRRRVELDRESLQG